MPLRVVTANDVDALLPTIQALYPAAIDRIGALDLFSSTNPFLIIGDPAVPKFARLERIVLPNNYPILAGQTSVHLTHLAPMRTQAFTRNEIVPMLAEILAQAVAAYPVLAQRPFWTHGSDAMRTRALQYFPQLQVTASVSNTFYLWYATVQQAAADLAPFRP